MTTPAITLVTPGFAPDTGGVEAHTSALAEELARSGVDVEVLTASRDLTRPTVTEYRGCRVVTYPAWRLRAMSISPQLVRAAVRRRGIGRVMHVHSYHATTALAVFGPSAPTVFTPHYHGRRGHSRAADLLHLGFFHVGKRLFRRCAAVVCVSEAERRLLLRDFPFLADKVSVIPNGISAVEIRRAEAFPGEPPTVLCVGRLESYKRVADVVRAFGDVPEPAQLVIVGDGGQREEIISLATDLDLAHRVRVLGKVTDCELHRWLRTAHVFVSMSEREAFGIAPLEAASAGARVIVSDLPAHREIVADFLGDGAVIQSDRSASALAAQICHQLAHPREQAARVPDWRDVTANTAEIYRSSVAGQAIPLSCNVTVPDKEIFA